MYRSFGSVDVRQNFLGVFFRDGCADRRLFTEWVAHLHRLRPFHQSRHKPFPDGLVNKYPRPV